MYHIYSYLCFNKVFFICYNVFMSKSKKQKSKKIYSTPFNKYFRILNEVDKNVRYSKEYGSTLILGLVEEVGEMARAYLAKHGHKKTNIAAQKDETYEQELGDILVAIIRFARIKKINLDDRIMYSLKKIEKRKNKPKT